MGCGSFSEKERLEVSSWRISPGSKSARREDLNGDQPPLMTARTEIDGSSDQLFVSSFPIDLGFVLIGLVHFIGRSNVE